MSLLAKCLRKTGEETSWSSHGSRENEEEEEDVCNERECNVVIAPAWRTDGAAACTHFFFLKLLGFVPIFGAIFMVRSAILALQDSWLPCRCLRKGRGDTTLEGGGISAAEKNIKHPVSQSS